MAIPKDDRILYGALMLLQGEVADDGLFTIDDAEIKRALQISSQTVTVYTKGEYKVKL